MWRSRPDRPIDCAIETSPRKRSQGILPASCVAELKLGQRRTKTTGRFDPCEASGERGFGGSWVRGVLGFGAEGSGVQKFGGSVRRTFRTRTFAPPNPPNPRTEPPEPMNPRTLEPSNPLEEEPHAQTALQPGVVEVVHA